MRSGSSAAELVRNATVVVCAGPSAAQAEPLGSGFLVAQGRALTCAHVIRQRRPLWVRWQGRTERVLGVRPDNVPSAGPVAFPDAAVLDVTALGPHPTVALTTDVPVEGARLYAYGITEVRSGVPEPDSSLLHYVGPAAAEDAGFYKLGGGDLASGQSGGAVLNLDTSLVCGMVKQSLRRAGQSGGIAVPIAAALSVIDDDVLAANRAEHDDTVEALRREQIHLEPLPRGVVDLVRDCGAVYSLTTALKDVGIHAPDARSAEDPEWVARQLFRCTVVQVVRMLSAARAISTDVARDILWRVVCCVPTDETEPTSWWVPAEAALAARTEWASATPRVVTFACSYPATGEHLASRALRQRITPIPLPDFSAETDDNGLPPELTEAIDANLAYHLGISARRWQSKRAEVVAQARDDGAVFALDGGLMRDRTLLEVLRREYAGLYYMGNSGDDEPGDLILAVRPHIDEDVEGVVEQAMTKFERTRG